MTIEEVKNKLQAEEDITGLEIDKFIEAQLSGKKQFYKGISLEYGQASILTGKWKEDAKKALKFEKTIRSFIMALFVGSATINVEDPLFNYKFRILEFISDMKNKGIYPVAINKEMMTEINSIEVKGIANMISFSPADQRLFIFEIRPDQDLGRKIGRFRPTKTEITLRGLYAIKLSLLSHMLKERINLDIKLGLVHVQEDKYELIKLKTLPKQKLL